MARTDFFGATVVFVTVRVFAATFTVAVLETGFFTIGVFLAAVARLAGASVFILDFFTTFIGAATRFLGGVVFDAVTGFGAITAFFLAGFFSTAAAFGAALVWVGFLATAFLAVVFFGVSVLALIDLGVTVLEAAVFAGAFFLAAMTFAAGFTFFSEALRLRVDFDVGFDGVFAIMPSPILGQYDANAIKCGRKSHLLRDSLGPFSTIVVNVALRR